jgi:hypothetical protein
MGFPNGARCGDNADCESMQCRAGACVAETAPGGGPIPCGDDDDCGSESRVDGGRVCEPRSVAAARDYACLPRTACASTGRICVDNTDCRESGSLCTTGCDRGICKQLGCLRQGAACTASTACCLGYFCTGPVEDGGIAPDAGHCQLSAPGVVPMNELCISSDQCVSGFCNTGQPNTCVDMACAKIGPSCAGGCCTGLSCKDSARCCIGSSKACVLDSSCCSGQCLAGFCFDQFSAATTFRVCRQLDLACGDDNDCCTGGCDAVEKQCMLEPRLLDGGTCSVDPKTQSCADVGGVLVCVEAYGACDPARPCCNGMTCTNGSCF